MPMSGDGTLSDGNEAINGCVPLRVESTETGWLVSEGFNMNGWFGADATKNWTVNLLTLLSVVVVDGLTATLPSKATPGLLKLISMM